jgi:DNA-3-methyladenine glycosylase II
MQCVGRYADARPNCGPGLRYRRATVFTIPPPLDEAALALAARELAARDPDLAAVVGRYGLPPLWSRPAGFPTLVHIVLEQQVSLASASAAFGRLRGAVEPLTPEGFLALDDARLLEIGFSRQKAGYVRDLARAVGGGTLDLDGLAILPDADVERALVAQRGIGPWTAAIYLMEALLRPDVWPVADIALATAVAEVTGLAGRPDPGRLAEMGEAWRPWRSVAARLFWHDYLSRRGRRL